MNYEIEKEMKKWAVDQDNKISRKLEKESLAKKPKKKLTPAEEETPAVEDNTENTEK